MMETKASNNGKFNYRCRAQTLSSECFYALAIGLKEVDQVIVWDRGRPARPDQATLNSHYSVSGRAGRPRSQTIT
jgi:hypothetical protein